MKRSRALRSEAAWLSSSVRSGDCLSTTWDWRSTHFQNGDWDDAAAELEAALAYGDDLDSQAGLIWVRSFMAHLSNSPR